MMKITELVTTKRPERILRLAAYCRVSSNSADQLHSFAAQIRYYTDYIKQHPQYELIDIYADEGLTGTCMNKRDELNRLIRDCKKGKIDRIITKSVSRFARNTQDLLMTLRMLKEIGVSVYFEEQGIDTDKMNMEMIVTFPGMVAQKESETISGNMRWSYKKRMESGDFNCCRSAYGYDMENGELKINETEAETVRRIFNLYLRGIGKQAIAKRLNDEGIPRRYGKDRWHTFTIVYILNNERYMGDCLLQKKHTTTTLPFRKMHNHGEKSQYYVENSNPPIVSRETYQAVQELQRARKTNTGKKQSYPLSRMLLCPDCGHTFRRQIISDKAYWICAYKTSGRTNCQNRRVCEEDVYDAFTAMVRKLSTYRQYILGSLIHQVEAMQDRTSENQQKIYQIDKEIADLSAQNLVVARLHTKGILNDIEYTAQSSDINQKISALRIERRKKLSEDEDDELLDSQKSLDDILSEYEPKPGFDEDLFEQIIVSITVVSNAELQFKLIGGLALIEKIQEKGKYIST